MTIASATPTDRDGAYDPGLELLHPDSDDHHAHEDQPDPVTLCEPSFDGDGLLRWASATFNVAN